MSTQPAIVFPQGIWTAVSGGMSDDTPYFITNETDYRMRIFEGATAPSIVEEGHTFSGSGGPVYVTKVSGFQFYVYAPSAAGKVVVSERA